MTSALAPIRVMNVISRLNIGGISPYVIPLTAHLRDMGYQSSLVAGSVGKREGDMSYLAERVNVNPIMIPSLGREISPLRDLTTIRQLYALMRRERPHIVHTHTAKAGFAGRIAAWLARVPIILHTYHGHVFAGYFGPAKTRFYLTLEQFCGRLSTRVITVSSYLSRELAGRYRVKRAVDVVIPGYDLDDLRDVQRSGAFRARFGIAPDAPLAAIIGRLVPIKNHALFLQAAARVRARLPAARFAVVGDGELRGELESLAGSLGLAGCVIFTGWQTDLPAIYGALDCNVLSSKNEGLPSSVIEALVTGVPVVATAVGGVNDLLAGDLGILVPPADADGLAAGIVTALTDPALRARAEASRAASYALYDIRASAARVDAYYRELLAAKQIGG